MVDTEMVVKSRERKVRRKWCRNGAEMQGGEAGTEAWGVAGERGSVAGRMPVTGWGSAGWFDEAMKTQRRRERGEEHSFAACKQVGRLRRREEMVSATSLGRWVARETRADRRYAPGRRRVRRGLARGCFGFWPWGSGVVCRQCKTETWCPKAEIRRPKSEGNPKAEIRNPEPGKNCRLGREGSLVFFHSEWL